MNAFHFGPGMVDRLGWVLVHSVWQLTGIALAALILEQALRRCTARTRYAMLTLALAAMTAAPVVTWLVLPDFEPIVVAFDDLPTAPESPVPQPAATAPTATAPPATHATAAIADGADVTDASTESPAAAGSTDVSRAIEVRESPGVWGSIVGAWSDFELAVRAWLPQIVGLWCLGVCVFAWRPAISWYEVGRLRRVGVTPVTDRVRQTLDDLARRIGLVRAVQILESARVRTPVVIGYLRPVILLPVSLVSQLPVSQLEAILAHELAHIRRHDFLVNLWQTLVETVLFYHPAVWWLSHRIRVERENCCDDIAVAVVENRVEYGRALLALEELQGARTTLALGARSGSLLSRIARLFPSERVHRTFDSGNLVAVGLLVSVILAVAVWTAANGNETEEPDDPNASYAEAVSDRLVSALKRQNLPYMTPEALAALRTELHDYLDLRMKTPLAGPRRLAVLKAIDKYVTQNFVEPNSYLEFRSHFDVLKWQLWTAADRPELSPAERKEREVQRQWMRRFIRSLPAAAPYAIAQGAHEAAIKVLEREGFDNPLNPFFRDPMSAEEFEAFKDEVQRPAYPLPSAPFYIFISAADVRIKSLEQRWPPGFPVTGSVHCYMGNDVWHFSLGLDVFTRDCGVMLDGAKTGSRAYLDIASHQWVYQSKPLDEKSTELWLAKEKRGDIWFDPETKQLIAVRGARLTTLDEREWYAIDRIWTSDLRKRVAESPIQSYSLAALPGWNERTPDSTAAHHALQKLPTLVIETADGNVAPLRVVHYDSTPAQVLIQVHGRPLPPYPPFNAGDGADDGQGARPTTNLETVDAVSNRFTAASSEVGESIDTLCDRFAAALEKQNLPFVTPQALTALKAELHDYLARRMTRPLAGARQDAVLAAIDSFVARNFAGAECYLNFRSAFETLGWLLWTTADRADLTPEQAAERESQRRWMRDFVGGLQNEPETTKRLLAELENDVFGNPLEPFFHEPMSAETFGKFKQQVEGERGTIYNAAVFVQLESLKQRWPLGFPDTGGSWSMPQGILFRYFPQSYYLRWSARPPSDRRLVSFDVIKSIETVQPPASDEEATESWRLKPKGDIGFDLATRSLIAMPGAKMATLDETQWYALDRIPTADLRRRLAEAPIDSYSLAKLPALLGAGALDAQRLPTFVVQTIAGGIVLMRIEHYSATDVNLGIRPRPLAPYPPFLAVEGAAKPKPAAGSDVSDALGASYVDAVCDRFAAALKKQDLPFVTPEAAAALRAELHDYLAERIKTPLTGADRDEVLQGVDRFVQAGFVPGRVAPNPDLYLTFRGGFDMLKWQLWTATDRRNLTPNESKERESQREWMRNYIRGVPEDDMAKTRPENSRAGQLKRLESDVFAYRLSPFFYEPMPADEFETFKTNMLKTKEIDPVLATHHIFAEAGFARIDSLLKRWPPGFPVNGIGFSSFVVFGPFENVFSRDGSGASLGGSEDTSREFYDLAKGYGVTQRAPLDAAATERWLTDKKRGDVWFDPATRRLIAVRGAKLAALGETEWYAIDRIPLAELRRRVAEEPLDSYSLDEIPDSDPSAAERIIRALPTLVLETAAGEVALLRVVLAGQGHVNLKVHRRPLPPYPPFHPGDTVAAADAPPKPESDEIGKAKGAEDAATAEPAAVEFYLAESEPAEGLKEAKVKGESNRLIYLHERPVLTRTDFAEARAEIDSNGRPTVLVKFTEAGAVKMGKATADNLGKRLAVVVDGEVVSTAMITPAYVASVAQAIAPGNPLAQGDGKEAAPAAGTETPTVEFYLGESEAGEGLKEAKVDGNDNELIYLHENPELTNEDIAQARPGVDSNGHQTIDVKFTDAGAVKMGKLTEANIGKRLALVVDGKVIFAATIRSQITDLAQITFSRREVAKLAHAIDPSSPIEQDEATEAGGGEPAAFSSDSERLRQIGLAMHNYYDVRQHFPDLAIRNVEGKPLLSWRVAILPHLDGGLELYKQFHLYEPWDSEHNRQLIAKMPDIFRSAQTALGRTRFLAPVGENLAFRNLTTRQAQEAMQADVTTPTNEPVHGKHHKGGLSMKTFTDGTSQTILVVEADPDHAVIWTRPEDLVVDLENPARGLTGGETSFLVLFADASVHDLLNASIRPDSLRALFTRNGGERIDRDELKRSDLSPAAAPPPKEGEPGEEVESAPQE